MSDVVERRGILKFISPNFLNINVLMIESLDYFDELHELLPNANFRIITTQSGTDINADYRTFDFKPFENTFDIIIAEDCLTYNYDWYKLLFGINRSLKETGFLVTQFESIRYIGVLESLRQGYFPERERKLYAKTEIVRLLNDTLFKEISFAKNETINYNIDDWLNFGFDNFNDELLTKNWIVKACRSTSEVANLKQFFTPEIRQQLARIIHRIEYNIDRESNIKLLKDFCAKYMIFDDYLSAFIEQIVIHREIFDEIQ